MIYKIAEKLAEYSTQRYNRINKQRNLDPVSVEVEVFFSAHADGQVKIATLRLPQEHTDVNEEEQLTGLDRSLDQVFLYVPSFGFPYLVFRDGARLECMPDGQEIFYNGNWIFSLPEPCLEGNFDQFMQCLLDVVDLIILSP